MKIIVLIDMIIAYIDMHIPEIIHKYVPLIIC
jgi:hypothetical protein